jgi:hypothetical protein
MRIETVNRLGRTAALVLATVVLQFACGCTGTSATSDDAGAEVSSPDGGDASSDASNVEDTSIDAPDGALDDAGRDACEPPCDPDAGMDAGMDGGAQPAAKRWNPGNCMLLYRNANGLRKAGEVVAEGDYLSCMTMRLDWDEIESPDCTTQGSCDRDWSTMDAVLDRLADGSKQAWFVIYRARFDGSLEEGDPDLCPVPEYVKNMNGELEGCAATKNGGIARFWREDVMSAEIAFLSDICERYDDHPAFQGIMTGESAPGFGGTDGVDPPADYSREALFEQLQRESKEMQSACVKSIFMQGLNFPTQPTAEMDATMAAVADSGAGLGGPDLCGRPDEAGMCDPDGETTAQKSYLGTTDGGTDFRGRIPVSFQIQPAGVKSSTTLENLYDFAHNVLQQHWTHYPTIGNGAPADQQNMNWEQVVLPALRTGDYPTRTDCPDNIRCAPDQ